MRCSRHTARSHEAAPTWSACHQSVARRVRCSSGSSSPAADYAPRHVGLANAISLGFEGCAPIDRPTPCPAPCPLSRARGVQARSFFRGGVGDARARPVAGGTIDGRESPPHVRVSSTLTTGAIICGTRTSAGRRASACFPSDAHTAPRHGLAHWLAATVHVARQRSTQRRELASGHRGAGGAGQGRPVWRRRPVLASRASASRAWRRN